VPGNCKLQRPAGIAVCAGSKAGGVSIAPPAAARPNCHHPQPPNKPMFAKDRDLFFTIHSLFRTFTLIIYL
jgi:hypothetical protein